MKGRTHLVSTECFVYNFVIVNLMLVFVVIFFLQETALSLNKYLRRLRITGLEYLETARNTE